MNHEMQVKKGGIVVINEWDDEIKKFVERVIQPDEIINVLNNYVCITPDLTLRDLFYLMSKNITVFSIVSGCDFLDRLVAEALSEPVEDYNDISFLELRRVATINNSDLYFYFDFSGKNNNDSYGIEFSPINSMCRFPIVLNENVLFLEKNYCIKKEFNLNMSFTLAELIRGVVEELSFAGTPETKTFARECLSDVVNEIDNKKIKFEEIKTNIAKIENEGIIPCKMCGGDARSCSFGKPEDICENCFDKIKEN